MTETWNDIKTAPLGTIIDVAVWNVGFGLDDGFRWTEVKLINHLPQVMQVYQTHDEGDGEWVEYDLSQNGQYASHWMKPPDLPVPSLAEGELVAGFEPFPHPTETDGRV